jgi:hypothetical protein
MKLLAIDIDNNTESSKFFNTAQNILNIELLKLPPSNIEGNLYKYGSFSKAAFALEDLVLATPEYWSKNKPFINVLITWGDYNTSGLENLKSYQSVYNKDLIVFSTTAERYEPNWVFGNIVAVTKWAGSLFKVTDDMPSKRDITGFNSNFNVPIWYATRIGLDVRAVNELVNIA